MRYGNQLIIFCDLGPIVKVTQGVRMLQNCSSIHFFLKEWMDFYKTCTNIFLVHGQELIILVTLIQFSRSHDVLEYWKIP